MERTNIRHLTELPEAPDLAVIDVSFISLRLALPPVFALVKPEAEIVALIKPQFEAGRQHVKKGGVVRDPAIHSQVIESLSQWSRTQPWRIDEVIPSPLTGPAGNVEFLSRWTPGGDAASLDRIRHAPTETAIISTGC
jgi:23S rRNA (cytidine1920-2'-O)/16S rRNA (cytidine1409-2'-O)-methyltransferase